MLRDDALPAAGSMLGAAAANVLAPAVTAAGGRLRSARATQVRYDPGSRLTVRYAADVVWADGSERRETLGALHDRRGLPAGLAVVESDDGAQVGVWRYPHDPFLPGLPQAAYPDGARRLLRELGVDAPTPRVTPVVYRPGSRAVLRVDTGGTSLYAKVVRPDRASAVRQANDTLAARAPVPRCLGWADALGLVVLAALPGRTLGRALADGRTPPPAPARVLGLLDRIGDVPVTGRSGDGEVAGHARLLTAVAPELRDRVAQVAAAAAVTAEPDRTVHGDFHQGQVLVDGSDVTGLLDVDGARPGAAHDDPAVLVAHLLVFARIRPRAAARVDRYRREVMALTALRADPVAVRRAAAGVLLGLATTPFRRQEHGWRARTRAWVELALAHCEEDLMALSRAPHEAGPS